MVENTLIRVTVEQRDKLKELAKAEDRTMISMLTILLDKFSGK